MLVRPRPDGVPADLGRPALPGSKSHTQRAMVLAAFGGGRWELEGALRAADTEVLAAALVACGACVDWHASGCTVTGRGGGELDVDVAVGENGTALRVLLLVVPLLGGRLRIDGGPGLRRRPLQPALLPLQAAGVAVAGTALPVVADGRGRRVALPPLLATTTTQAATGALLGLALRAGRDGGGAELRVQRPRARGYLELTAAMLRTFGWQVAVAVVGDEVRYTVAGAAAAGGTVAIPGDPSARAFPLALAALHGLDGASVLPAPAGDPHPDLGIDADLRALGAAGGGPLRLETLGERPDCVPAVATVAATRTGATTLAALPALRHKESDRLAAMAAGLRAAGALCRDQGDDLLVAGPLPRLPAVPRELPTVPDHRIVMALSLLGTVLPAGVRVGHADAVGKSWPGFWDWLGRVAEVAPAG